MVTVYLSVIYNEFWCLSVTGWFNNKPVFINLHWPHDDLWPDPNQRHPSHTIRRLWYGSACSTMEDVRLSTY